MQYKGTILLVSHDRSFINNIVTSTIVFEKKGVVKEYVGGYDDWIRQRPTEVIKKKKATKIKQQTVDPRKKGRKLGYMEERELKSLPEKIEKLEAQILSARDAAAIQIAQHESEALRTQVSEAQDKALSLMEEAELIAAKGDSYAASAAEALHEVDVFRSQAGEDEAELLSEVQTLENRREEIVDRMGNDAFQRYEKLRVPKKGRPVSRLVEGACEGCGIQLNPTEQGHIRMAKELRCCSSCERILVDAPLWARGTA